MAEWVGPTVAISIVLIALCCLALTAVALVAARRASQATDSMASELAELRHDLSPALEGLNRIGTTGGNLIERFEDEADKVLETSQSIRREVLKGVTHTRNRLADLDALLEVATDEAESALVDAAAAVQSFRTTAGLLGHVGRLLQPRDQDDPDYEDDEADEPEDDAEEEAPPRSRRSSVRDDFEADPDEEDCDEEFIG